MDSEQVASSIYSLLSKAEGSGFQNSSVRRNPESSDQVFIRSEWVLNIAFGLNEAVAQKDLDVLVICRIIKQIKTSIKTFEKEIEIFKELYAQCQ